MEKANLTRAMIQIFQLSFLKIMREYNLHDLINTIKSDSTPVVLYGAGTLGKLSQYALKRLDVEPIYFCDGDKQKQGKLYYEIKTISPQELSELDSDAHIFLCNNYLSFIVPQLKQAGFKNIYNCVALLENTDFSGANLDILPLNIKRQIAMHKSSCQREDPDDESLNLKYVDIIVTERCSLRCRDCSNLMQYYTSPKNCDLNLLLNSVDKLMKCIDGVNEFRVIGGEPFMNNELYKIINKLITYDNAKNIIIYTNATIPPIGNNLSCLKNDKVAFDITNYGALSRNFDQIIKILKGNNIKYVVNDIKGVKWNDCASIKFQPRSEEEIVDMFKNCCVNDVLSLLHGKLYHCPFSANATNLSAIPFNKEDEIDLTEDLAIDELRKKIIDFYKNKSHLLACYYCRGRAYDGNQIEPAVQAKQPLSLDRQA